MSYLAAPPRDVVSGVRNFTFFPPEEESWSERRVSNPRLSAWKADALPTELLSRNEKDYSETTLLVKWVVQEMFGVRCKESIIT